MKKLLHLLCWSGMARKAFVWVLLFSCNCVFKNPSGWCVFKNLLLFHLFKKVSWLLPRLSLHQNALVFTEHLSFAFKSCSQFPRKQNEHALWFKRMNYTLYDSETATASNFETRAELFCLKMEEQCLHTQKTSKYIMQIISRQGKRKK